MVSSSRVNGFLQMAPSGPVVNVTCYAKSTWKRWTTNHPDHSFKKKEEKKVLVTSPKDMFPKMAHSAFLEVQPYSNTNPSRPGFYCVDSRDSHENHSILL